MQLNGTHAQSHYPWATQSSGDSRGRLLDTCVYTCIHQRFVCYSRITAILQYVGISSSEVTLGPSAYGSEMTAID